MKFLFTLQQNVKEVDVDPTLSHDALKDVLVKQYGYKDGTYKFIFKGKVIGNTTAPLQGIPEGSKIFLYIKASESAPAESKPAEAKPAPQPQPVQAPPRPAPLPAQPAPQPVPRPSPIPPQFQQNQPRPQPANDLQQLEESVIKPLHLREIYDPANEITNNMELTCEVSEILRRNPLATSVFLKQEQLSQPVYLANSAHVVFNIASMLGVPLHDFTMPESDFDAELEQLSRQQKEKYDALVKDFEQQKEKVLESLINNDFDSVKARAELESH